MLLKFSRGNAKLDSLEQKTGKRVYTFSTLAGYACPFAKACLSKAIVHSNGSRTIQDGKHNQFRCFSASQEVLFTNTYKARKHNFDLLTNSDNQFQLIQDSLPKYNKPYIVRINVSGDIFNQDNFDAWMEIAKANPQHIFYAYTKSLLYWIRRLNELESIPNFVLTASEGGSLDSLIPQHNLRYVKVVYSVNEAKKLKLPIDHDDYHAFEPKLRNQSFSLLLHGIQPAGTEAAAALKKLNGEGSYHRSKKRVK